MVNQYIERFRNGTVDQRRSEIIRLGKSGDLRAIAVLKQIAEQESDPNLQKIALRAVHHLENIVLVGNDGVKFEASSLPELPVDIKKSTPDPLFPVDIASPSIENSTKSKLDQVIELQIARKLNDAFILLVEIVRSDESILNSTIAANLAMTLTDLPRDQAIAIVLAKSKILQVGKPKSVPKLKSDARNGYILDTLLETLALLIVLVLIFTMARVGAVPLANHLLANLKGVASQYSTGGTDASKALADSLTQLTNGKNGQPINSVALAALEAQMRQGQFTANSPEFRATIIAGLLSTLSHTQLAPSSMKTTVFDSVSGAAYIFFTTLFTVVAIFIIGAIFRGKSGIVRFFYFMVQAYLITYGLVFVGMALWLFVLNQPTMSSSLQSLLFVIGLLFIMASALFGFRIQITAASRAHLFGRFRGFISVSLGTMVISIVFALPALSYISHMFR